MKMLFNTKVFFNTFDNDNDAAKPEIWAMEALLLLQNNTVVLPTVNKQFKNDLAKQGQVVHAYRPQKFEAERKVDGDDVVIQDAKLSQIDVRLDFHLHTSFMLYPQEMSMSMLDLVDTHLRPAFQSIFQEVDELLIGMKYRFMSTAIVGSLGSPLTKSSLIDINKRFNKNIAPNDGERWFMMGAEQEADLLDDKLFTDASQVGDDGTALRDASIGKKFGVNCVQCNNVFTVEPGNTVTTSTQINHAGGYGAGTTVLTVDGGTTIVAGSWCVIAGDDRPRRITVVNATPATQITLESGIESLVADNAVITVYAPGAVNHAGGYDANYPKRMTVDGFTVAPQAGQLVSFGTVGTPYSLIGQKNTTTSLKLSRGLDNTTADNTVAAIGPAGEYGFAYHRDAITLVTRPLELPEDGMGVKSGIAYDEKLGMGMRVTMSYLGTKQGTLVTADILCGTEVLDNTQGMLVVR